MKKILFTFLLVPIFSFSQDAKEIAKKCMPSTVSVIMEDKYNQPLSLGSGFIVGDGKIITNVHVIKDAIFGYAIISGETQRHKIEGYFSINKKNDLVLLSVPTLKAKSIEFSPAKPEIGEKIYAIGNPKGLSGTISEGIVSGIRSFENEDLIQITAPISPGSSGGPVINNQGQLIGVSVSTLESGQNLNFAIPSTYVIELIGTSTNQMTKLNIKSVPKKANPVIKNITEGIEIINLEWEYFQGINRLQGFSIKNNLSVEVNNVKLLVVLRNSQGIPIDYAEINLLNHWRESIKPHLSLYIDIRHSYVGLGDRIRMRKNGEKLEMRILDFTIKE
ncbi:trypsin-like peptidase domain-containing protein [Flavobacterium sp.]|jgi:S1-C subfamily serine protease|uniref:trypsin-like peptidase domain-containing protein n=1 Tax=Flavobacterium sp. TaxID=239 RepID=UPI0037BF7A9F